MYVNEVLRNECLVWQSDAAAVPLTGTAVDDIEDEGWASDLASSNPGEPCLCNT